MFDHRHYVPILKGREVEYGALQILQDRTGLMPPSKVPPIPWDYEEERPAKTIDKHLEKVAQKIQRRRGVLVAPTWGSSSRARDGRSHQLGQADGATALRSGSVAGAVQGAAGALVGDGTVPNDWAAIYEDKTHTGGIV